MFYKFNIIKNYKRLSSLSPKNTCTLSDLHYKDRKRKQQQKTKQNKNKNKKKTKKKQKKKKTTI